MRLKHGEKLFKLTLYELSEDEVPDKLYGEHEQDSYQDANGITPSSRMIPANIPESRVVRRTERNIDPTKQLLESGHPFSHIGTELINLHGKFEIVSRDVVLLRTNSARCRGSLGGKSRRKPRSLRPRSGK